MDIGIVSSRYAKALYRYAAENKEEARVYAEMRQLDTCFGKVEAFSSSLSSPVLTEEQKNGLLLAAASAGDKTDTSETVARFFRLVIDRKRTELMRFIANSYISIYEKANNRVKGHLVVARPVSEEIVKRLKALVETRTESRVNLEVDVDSSIGGGFILQYGDNRMDASIHGQLERIRRELM